MPIVWLADPEPVSLYAERRSAGKYPDGVVADGCTSLRTSALQVAAPAVAAAQTWVDRCAAPLADGAAPAIDTLTETAAAAAATTAIARVMARMDPPVAWGNGGGHTKTPRRTARRGTTSVTWLPACHT